jgi:hypothetical protein
VGTRELIASLTLAACGRFEFDPVMPPECELCTDACGTEITAPLDVPPTGWTFNGVAAFDPAMQSALLTDLTTSSSGSLMYDRPLLLDNFEVELEFAMSGGTGADGMGIVLVTDGPSALGATGGGLGMVGLSGYGIEIDSHSNSSSACMDTSDSHLAVNELSRCGPMLPTSLATADLPFVLTTGAWHAVRASWVNGTVSVVVDGTPYMTDFAIPGFVAMPRYIGVTASNGVGSDRHDVRGVRITFAAPHCL